MACWRGERRFAFADDEALIFTPPGFDRPGVPAKATGADVGQVEVVVLDPSTGKPTPCRINVVGPDGHFYQPADNPLSPYSLTGQWPKTGKGNREGKAPIRYFGRFFYTTGSRSTSPRERPRRGLEGIRVPAAAEGRHGGRRPDDLRCDLELDRTLRCDRSATTRATPTCTSPARPRPTTASSSTCSRPRTSISARSSPTTSRPARTRA